MHIHQRIWHYFVKHRIIQILSVQGLILAITGFSIIGNLLGGPLIGAFAQSPCSTGDRLYIVASGDTLGAIASHYRISLQRLATYNHIANPNVIYRNQRLCIPGKSSKVNKGHGGGNKPGKPGGYRPPIGHSNTFPYGQCTWWANHRFYQIHHIYVPWENVNANAWQWTGRAYSYHWHVSSRPSYGAIVNLQPGVQGAWGAGHVAVVERVLRNGNVIASNMNWGRNPYQVVYVEFTPGRGVTFISY
ncbi:MAG TPA: CHAP domain-containing protein [Ktedonobacteraceae bacterium]|nr:CHAP domain-containing protein [Ktedonobacteraceae bacterium]